MTYNGTLIRGTGTFAAGKFGNARTAGVYQTTAITPVVTTGTIEGWVNNTSNSFANALSTSSSSTYVGVNAYFVCQLDGTYTQSTVAGNDGVWHHVAITADGTTFTLWVDGVSKVTKASANPLIPAVDTFLIGGTIATGNDFLGSIDEVRISNVVRYTAPFTPPTALFANTTANTIALYHLESDATDTTGAAGTAPSAPTIGTATSGSSSASVAFTAPSSNGGAAITVYTAKSSPGGFTGTAATSPVTVSGLTNGTAYTFTVTATNSAGAGPASAASNSVTPMFVYVAPAKMAETLLNPKTTSADVTPAAINAEPAIIRTGATAGAVLGFDGINLTLGAPVGPGPTYNLAPQNLKLLRRALARVTAGAAPGLIVCVGDSTTESISGSAFSWPVFLSKSLSAAGIPSAVTWMHPKVTIQDARVVIGAGITAGGNNWAGTGTVTFSPSTQNMNGPAQVDTFEIYGDNVAYTVSVNGGAAVAHTAPLITTGAVDKYVVTCPRGAANVLTITVTTSGILAAVRAYDSTTPVMEVSNFGLSSTSTGNFSPNQAVWVSTPFIALTMKPDCVVMDLGINDADPSNNVSAATYGANINAIVTYFQGQSSDVILKSMAPTAVALNATQAPLQVAYQPYIKSTAVARGCPLFDGFARWQSYETSNPLGYYNDARHPSTSGNADMGRGIAAIIRNL